ncbi:hypothetical protein BC962_3238 [Gillisia mitskevichiae]|uniref:DUF3899 domain-containing protein n=1 Tax=Gillisia mitskevichiae TaxID=270921 RepID=A0A495NVT7_9FLAO|nr:hypothetical protein [Gillisia mitskevichiae]RKS42571.1 hypothetical protein BC962_3238 [Gillisia mitskevichiae]
MAIIYDMERIIERQKLSSQGLFYSVQRIDLLIVSISGAGIYLCLETLKYLKDNNLELGNLIKWSGGILLLAIIINFVSQFLGNKSNYYDYLYCGSILDAENNPDDAQQAEINKYDCISDVYDKFTTIFNYASAILMLSGLILLISYFLFIF